MLLHLAYAQRKGRHLDQEASKIQNWLLPLPTPVQCNTQEAIYWTFIHSCVLQLRPLVRGLQAGRTTPTDSTLR